MGFPGVAIRYNRATGEQVGPAIQMMPSDIPYRMPSGHAALWRYMHLNFFEDLCEKSSIYLTRVDLFKDSIEGKHAPENSYRTSSFDRLQDAAFPNGDTYDSQVKAQDLDRRRTFASCWHINEKENLRMWHCKPPGSVAVRTSVGRFK